MILAIVGPGRSGKDTVARWLRDHTPMRFTRGSSEAAATIVWEAMRSPNSSIWPPVRYETPEECWQDRHAFRADWARIIGEYNTPDQTRLNREMLRDQDIIVGLRWADELAACTRAGMFQLVMYFHRPACHDSTCQITPEMADVVINNTGTEPELFCKLSHLFGF